MKIFRTTTVMAFAITFLYSCKKETTSTQALSTVTTAEDAALAGNTRWLGDYIADVGGAVPHSKYNIPDKYFIKDGYARIYSDSIKPRGWNYYATAFRLTIPASKNIDGDNITFEAGVKNPFNSSFYIPYHGRDVGLRIKGTTDSAFINNVTPDSIRPDAHLYAIMQIGNNTINNVTALQYLFEDWGTLVLQTFNSGLVAYRNDQYLHGLPYNGQPKIGRLKEITISFKGSGFIDWIKLSNSATGDLIMSEDFNTDGKSTVVWY